MVMRVTQQSLYGNVISQANATLLGLVQTNEQVASEKRINKPSDDPSGTVEVLNTRSDISRLTQYESNITQASGWLTQQDSVLTSTSTLVTSIKELAEQAATGSMTADNRDEIANQVREYFEQLISLANTQYSGSYLFSGQKSDTQAYGETLWMNSNDDAFDAAVDASGGFTISGDTDYTALVQFTGTDTVTHQPSFNYSLDGGETWVSNGTYTASATGTSQILNLGDGLNLELSNSALDAVTAGTDTDSLDGTCMWIRPSAVYQGNDNDTVTVISTNTATVSGSASGTFSSDVVVRVDSSNANFAAGSTFKYSYSLDGGVSWVEGNTSGVCDGTSSTLSVPGGLLTLTNSGGTVSTGSQFLIQPSTADISIAISDTDAVVVNGVGKDIFGGVYQATGASNASAVTFNNSDSANLLETVGKLVGYLETNNQDGIEATLEDLTASQNQILEVAASVGGRENRVTSAKNMVSMLKDNANTTLSSVEDADITELMTKLAQQELAFHAVLKSSSMVMNLSLLKYV